VGIQAPGHADGLMAPPAMHPSRPRLATVLALALVLLWPAAFHGQPAFFFDTPGYVATGEAAFRHVERLLLPPDPAAAPAEALRETPGDVVATRAAAYSLFAAATAGPARTMWPTIVVQALLVALVVAIAWAGLAPESTRRDRLIAIGAVGLATSAPWFVSYVMPDVWAGVLLLGVALLAAGLVTALWPRLLLVAAAAFGIGVHASHVLLGAGLLAAAIAVAVLGGWRQSRGPLLWAGGAVLLGIAATMLLSLVGLREASLAPKRLPYALARSIEDGPGRWYLEASCATERYTICRFFTRFPDRHTEVLFGPTGIRSRATPAEMEAMRREEVLILERVAQAYPLETAARAAGNFGRQLVAIELGDLQFDQRLVPDPKLRLALADVPNSRDLRAPFDWLIAAGVLAAFAHVFAVRRTLGVREWQLLGVLAAGLLANAAITGVLSAVADRYQSRVIWVLPVVALGLWLARRPKPGPELHADEDDAGVEMIGEVQAKPGERSDRAMAGNEGQ
jgi:hypothetical protein